MVYIETINLQAVLFMKVCGFGFLLGMLYEVFRVLRILLTKAKYVVFWDLLYMTVCAILTFLFLLTYGNGVMRTFCFFALIGGWTVYYLTLGKVTEGIIDLSLIRIKRLFKFLKMFVLCPIMKFFELLKRPFKSFRQICIKFLKKVLKKFKFHLKFTNRMLYNLKR